MSRYTVDQAFEADVGDDRAALLVLVAMASKAKNGRIFPAVSTVAAMTRYSERQVHRIIARLVEKGVLELVERARQHRPNEYRIRGDAQVSTLRDDTTTSTLGESRVDTRVDILTPRVDISGARVDIQLSPERIERNERMEAAISSCAHKTSAKVDGFLVCTLCHLEQPIEEPTTGRAANAS